MATLLARLSPGAGYEDGSDSTQGASEPVSSGLVSLPSAVVPETITGTVEYIVITARCALSTTEQAGNFTDSMIRYKVGSGSYVVVPVTAWPVSNGYETRVTAQIPLNPSGQLWSAADLNALTLDCGATFDPQIPGNTGVLNLAELYADAYGSQGPVVSLGGYTSYDLDYTDPEIGAAVLPEIAAAIRRGDRRYMERR